MKRRFTQTSHPLLAPRLISDFRAALALDLESAPCILTVFFLAAALPAP